MRSFITLAVLYAAFAAAAPFPQTDPNLADGLGAAFICLFSPPIDVVSSLDRRQLSGAPDAVFALKQKGGKGGKGGGLGGLGDALGGITSALTGVIGTVTGVVTTLESRQLGGVTDTVSALKQNAGETVAGTGLTTALDGRQFGGVLDVEEYVDDLIGEISTVDRRQPGDPGALIGDISVVAPTLDHDINLGSTRHRRQVSTLEGDVDPILASAVGGLILRQLDNADVSLVGVTAVAEDVLNNADIDVLRSRSPGYLTRRQDDDIEQLIGDVLDILRSLSSGDRSRRQIQSAKREISAVPDEAGLPANNLVRRQSGGGTVPSIPRPEAVVPSFSDLIDTIDQSCSGLGRRQSTEPSPDGIVDEAVAAVSSIIAGPVHRDLGLGSESVPARADGVGARADGLVLRQSGGISNNTAAAVALLQKTFGIFTNLTIGDLGTGLSLRHSPESSPKGPSEILDQVLADPAQVDSI